ncbi:hypothetical protein K443DRAFT_257995 [Laccaria amethystina LaAM-08-1]|uniref:Uncharacterized protein n=1 Tax=Laccaria amethystina LaAM-08-1 TaxID=1095629 RepID=A0A0C9XM23_9AGAR|nr:hypothetical protein K443DRAFT_257995 [Laccaria amethystina LaAM-08-1]
MHVVITARTQFRTIAGKGIAVVFFTHTQSIAVTRTRVYHGTVIYRMALCMLFYHSYVLTHEQGSNLVRTEIERGMECGSRTCLLGK